MTRTIYGCPMFHWPSVNWRSIMAALVAVVLYPVYAMIKAWRVATRAANTTGVAVERWYWSLDAALVQSAQMFAIIIVGMAAMLISPARVMAA